MKQWPYTKRTGDTYLPKKSLFSLSAAIKVREDVEQVTEPSALRLHLCNTAEELNAAMLGI